MLSSDRNSDFIDKIINCFAKLNASLSNKRVIIPNNMIKTLSQIQYLIDKYIGGR